MTRKNAIIVIIITILIAIGVVLYLTFFMGGNNDSNLTNKNGDSGVNTFFPTSNNSDSGNSEDTPQNNFQVSIPHLRQLSNVPVSGFMSFEREIETTSLLFEENIEEGENVVEEDTTETVFRYVERSTGNIYETTARSLTTTRITNTTIPKIYEAIFTDDGEGVVLRYLDNSNSIETFVASIVKEDVEETEEIEEEIDIEKEGEEAIEEDVVEEKEIVSELVGTFLPKNIVSITKSPDSNSFFYIVKKDGRSLGYVFDFKYPEDGELVFQSDITQWTSEWYGGNKVNLYKNPTKYLEGFSFILDLTTGRLTKVIDGVYGLSTKTSPDGNNTLFSYNDLNNIKIGSLNRENNRDIIFNFNTLTEKCIWSSDTALYCAVPKSKLVSDFPDIWYQGSVSFNDSLLSLDLLGNKITNVAGLGENNFDIINPQLSVDGDYYVFMNKKDLTLWSLDLSI